jgi:glycosyltransferase involved in cell wall biosynthesis
MQAVVAHEWLVDYAGSERVAEAILDAFPDARLLTTVVDRDSVPPRLAAAEPSLLQHLPRANRHHGWLLPLMPAAWRFRRPISDADVVISSSHACAKGVHVAQGIPHVCYCHTPMRYAWFFDAEAARFPRAARPLARVLMRAFRRWDRRSAKHVTAFVANSSAVADRIGRFYGRRARVIFPPVDTEFFTPGEERGDFFLFVGRLVAYKRPELVIEAFRELDHPLVVVGRGPLGAQLRRDAPPNVTFVELAGDEQLRSLYRRALAVICPAEEDFGIAMAEAQACGTAVIAVDSGGARDIVEPGKTGWLLSSPDVAALRLAVQVAAGSPLAPADIRASATRFARDRFVDELQAFVSDVLVRGAA